MPNPSEQEWLLINQLAGLTPLRLQAILQQLTPRQLLTADPELLNRLKLSQECQKSIGQWQFAGWQSPLGQAVKKDLDWQAQSDSHHILSLDHPVYPALLKTLTDPPPILFVQGNVEGLQTPQVAIVGSRQATPLALDNASLFAGQLVHSGFTVTSGLALGIDAAAHQGALQSSGLTVAVLGAGLDKIYPARHRYLAEQIVASGGALVSEFPIGAAPRAYHFPRRNRVISGLSLAVLVVEAAPGSGSLITAEQALEQGREVMAVPGSIRNPLAQGCHQLIQQGAKLVSSVDDILVELPKLAGSNQIQISGSKQPDSGWPDVLTAVEYDPTPMDLIADRTGLSISQLSEALLSLELDGRIINSPGGYCRV